jgi:hypothetical protein
VAKVIFIDDVARARRRANEREVTERCIEIVQLNVALALHHFQHGPESERAVRARQIRQLAEMLEYMTT